MLSTYLPYRYNSSAWEDRATCMLSLKVANSVWSPWELQRLKNPKSMFCTWHLCWKCCLLEVHVGESVGQSRSVLQIKSPASKSCRGARCFSSRSIRDEALKLKLSWPHSFNRFSKQLPVQICIVLRLCNRSNRYSSLSACRPAITDNAMIAIPRQSSIYVLTYCTLPCVLVAKEHWSQVCCVRRFFWPLNLMHRSETGVHAISSYLRLSLPSMWVYYSQQI